MQFPIFLPSLNAWLGRMQNTEFKIWKYTIASLCYLNSVKSLLIWSLACLLVTCLIIRVVSQNWQVNVNFCSQQSAKASSHELLFSSPLCLRVYDGAQLSAVKSSVNALLPHCIYRVHLHLCHVLMVFFSIWSSLDGLLLISRKYTHKCVF